MQACAQVIPFRFETREVRTLLIDDQPWFVAVDVCASLGLSDTNKALIGLDEDEKREHEQYSGSGRKPILINESGLYSLILRSRKAEAKRFKKWVTAEVLPAIRKQGRYDDAGGQMRTLLGHTIGTDGFHCLGAVLDGKVRHLPSKTRQRAKMHVWSQVHKAFSVVSAEDIPASQIDSARNFIAAYAIEGEWLAKEAAKPLELHFPASLLLELNPHLRSDFNKDRITLGVKALCGMDVRSPTLKLIGELTRAGHNLEACKLEILAMRGHLESYWDLCQDMQHMGENRLNRGVSLHVAS